MQQVCEESVDGRLLSDIEALACTYRQADVAKEGCWYTSKKQYDDLEPQFFELARRVDQSEWKARPELVAMLRKISGIEDQLRAALAECAVAYANQFFGWLPDPRKGPIVVQRVVDRTTGEVWFIRHSERSFVRNFGSDRILAGWLQHPNRKRWRATAPNGCCTDDTTLFSPPPMKGIAADEDGNKRRRRSTAKQGTLDAIYRKVL